MFLYVSRYKVQESLLLSYKVHLVHTRWKIKNGQYTTKTTKQNSITDKNMYIEVVQCNYKFNLQGALDNLPTLVNTGSLEIIS